MAIVHKYTLVCDEIRKEDNGKFLIVGLYTPDLTFPKIPATIRSLAFMVVLDSDAGGKYQFKFKLVNKETGKDILAGGGEVAVLEAGAVFVPLQFPTPIRLERSGTYELVVDLSGVVTTYAFKVIALSESTKH